MKSYVLLADPDTREVLKRNRVEFTEWNDKAVLISDFGNLGQALAALNAAAIDELPTDFADLIAVTLRRGIANVTRRWQPDLMIQAGLLAGQAAEAEPREEENDEETVSSSSDDYVKFFRSRINTQDEEARLKEKLARELKNATTQFLEASRRQAFPDGNPSREAVLAKLESELEQIRKHPAVIDARPIPHGVLVRTKKLYATAVDTNLKHEIGEFYIWIRLPLEEAGVVWTNRTRRLRDSGHNAPTIGKDGIPFDSEIRQVILDLVARFELAQLVDLAIQCVEVVPAEQAAALAVWPLAE